MEQLETVYPGVFQFIGNCLMSHDCRYSCSIKDGNVLEYKTPHGIFTVNVKDDIMGTFRRSAPRYMNMKKYLVNRKVLEKIEKLKEENVKLSVEYLALKPREVKYKEHKGLYYHHWNENTDYVTDELGHYCDNWCEEKDLPKYTSSTFLTQEQFNKLTSITLKSNYHSRCIYCNDFAEYCKDPFQSIL